MILTRSPLRISLGGGGTDLPSYYAEHGGFLIAAAIDKYVYVSVTKPFTKGIFLKYSEIETVDNVQEIQHRIIREVLTEHPDISKQIEITTLADIPAGTGLGSSGSFTTALIKAIYQYKNEFIHPKELAEYACHIEIEKLGEPIGKQDQYVAAYGGISEYIFDKNGKVNVKPLKISPLMLAELEDNLLLFFTGYSRSASTILREQDNKSKEQSPEMIDNLHFVKDLGLQSKKYLLDGNIAQFGELMNEHWQHKKKRSQNMSNSKIDEIYTMSLRNGAIGGKVVGAGGGGFLMFVAHDRQQLRKFMETKGLQEVRFKLEFEGAKTIIA